MIGFSLSGPKSREILSKLCAGTDVSHLGFPFMAVKTMDVGMSRDAVVARVSLTGELGYEVTVPAHEHRALYEALLKAGGPFGMKNIGNKALESLRHEKGYGIWSTEFTQEYTPGHLLTHSLTHSLTYSLTHSLTHSLTQVCAVWTNILHLKKIISLVKRQP